MNGPGVVRLRGVSVRFGAKVALDGVDAEFAPGEAHALIGPNGSGKSTVLRLLAGLLEPTTGTVDLGRPRPRVAYVMQRHDHRSWMPLTAGEVVRMGGYAARGLLGRLRADDRRRIADASACMEVADLAHRQFGELSGGQQQRVMIAQALVQAPELLLLDEPITGLDLASQEQILRLVDQERDAGTTVVLATHNLDEARHADQVLLLDGRVVAAGAPDAVLAPDVLAEAYAGRVLGDHRDHDHAHDLLVIDDHGHGTH